MLSEQISHTGRGCPHGRPGPATQATPARMPTPATPPMPTAAHLSSASLAAAVVKALPPPARTALVASCSSWVACSSMLYSSRVPRALPSVDWASCTPCSTRGRCLLLDRATASSSARWSRSAACSNVGAGTGRAVSRATC